MSSSQWEFQLWGIFNEGTSFLLSFLTASTTRFRELQDQACIDDGRKEIVLIVCDYSYFKSVTEEPDVRTRKIVKVVTQTMVNGKVVDESSEVERFEEHKK